MSKKVCPWWLGYWLINPLRRLMHDPDKILAPFVRPDMTVLDVGPGMGYFSLPLAKLVGPAGKVVCVDLQEKMLKALQRRAVAAGVAERIVTRVCTSESLCIGDLMKTVDFALAFAVVHEVPDQAGLYAELFQALKPGGLCLVAEPKGHVTAREFEASLAIAVDKGFKRGEALSVLWSHAYLLEKPGNGT